MKERELIKELQEKLEWYTLHATEEEYDEKAVESILYLLDMLTPIADEDIPDVNAAWQQKGRGGTSETCRNGGREKNANQAA